MLNNFKYWLETFVFNNTALQTTSDTTASSNLKRSVKATDGSSWISYYRKNTLSYSMLGIVSTSINGDGTGIILGTDGNTKTVEESFKLGSDITSNFTLSSPSSSVTFKDGKIQLIVSAKYENGTDQPLTINEIGLTRSWSAYVGSTMTKKVLLDRKSVADENFTPVTLAPGESKIFMYVLEF